MLQPTKPISGSQAFWLSLSWNSLKNRSISLLNGFLQVRLLGSLDRGSKMKVWTLLGDNIEHFFPSNDVLLQWLNDGTEPHTTEKSFEQSFDGRATTPTWQSDWLTRGCWAIPNLPIRKTRTAQSVTALLCSAWGMRGDWDAVESGKLQKPPCPVQEPPLSSAIMTLYVHGKPLIPQNRMMSKPYNKELPQPRSALCTEQGRCFIPRGAWFPPQPRAFWLRMDWVLEKHQN